MKLFLLLSLFVFGFSPTPDISHHSPLKDRTVIYRCVDGTIHIVKEKTPNPCGKDKVDVKIVVNSVYNDEVVDKIDKMGKAERQKLAFQLQERLELKSKKRSVSLDKNRLSDERQFSNQKVNTIDKRQVNKDFKDDRRKLAIDNCPCGYGWVVSCPKSVTCKTCCEKAAAVKKELEDLLK